MKRLVASGAVALIAAACSSSPAASDLFPNDDAGIVDAGQGLPEAASPPPTHPPPPSGDDAGPKPETCPDGRKSCGGVCVSLDDPRTGCGAPSCAPCAIPHGTAKCVSGACAAAECEPGRADCNGNASDGCEVDVTADPKHCGACTTACGTTQVCGPNGCASSCSGALVECNGGCVDVASNADNCATCGNKCTAPANGVATCVSKACSFSCDAGYNRCGSQCLPDSPSSCGASCLTCAQPPNSTATCISGACGFTCNSGYEPCSSGTQCCAIPPPDAGSDGGGGGGACDATTSCLTNVAMGTVRGDIGTDVVQASGKTSEWLRVTVAEGDSSIFAADLKFTATLTSPPGMDFNLFVYQSPCNSGLYGQSTNTSAIDTVTGGWGDILGSDETRTVILEVRYASGGTCGGPSWALEVDGNR
jgi:hypothetical protein